MTDPHHDRRWIITAYALAFGSLLRSGVRPEMAHSPADPVAA